jgi:flagellar basal-body rod modification protein FlgD
MTSIPAAITPTATPASATSAAKATDKNSLASNFQSFLLLLTTQLQNQNPLEPLDTNQFTQQLVQFAQVEQQLKSNQQLETLVALQKSAQTTQALGFAGATVAVDGATTRLANGRAAWHFAVSKPATATVTIANASGQTVYSGSYTVQPGAQNFVWDGHGTNGTLWPDGAYTMSITALDTSKQPVAVSTEVEGVVDSVDLTKNPPLLSIGGQDFTLDQIKRVTKPGRA